MQGTTVEKKLLVWISQLRNCCKYYVQSHFLPLII